MNDNFVLTICAFLRKRTSRERFFALGSVVLLLDSRRFLLSLGCLDALLQKEYAEVIELVDNDSADK